MAGIGREVVVQWIIWHCPPQGFRAFCFRPPDQGLTVSLGKQSCYGKGKIFVNRLESIERFGRQYFIRHPNQTVESEFDEPIFSLKSYSQRRHDIAHGIVDILPTKEHQRMDTIEFALITSFYVIDRPRHTKFFPTFAYNASTLLSFESKFSDLGKHVRSFTYRLFQIP
jgi:hypothetical protein